MEIHRRPCLFHLRGGTPSTSYRIVSYRETYTHRARAKNASRFQIMQPERRGCGRGPKLVTVTRATVKAGRRAGCGLVNTQRTEFANVLNLVGRLEHKPQSNHGSPHSHPSPPLILPTEYTLYLAYSFRVLSADRSGGREEGRRGDRMRSSVLCSIGDLGHWQVEILRIFFSI